MNTSITLLIPKKTDIENEQVFSAWIENGGQVKRLDKFWIKDEELAKQRIAINGNQAFAFVVAQSAPFISHFRKQGVCLTGLIKPSNHLALSPFH